MFSCWSLLLILQPTLAGVIDPTSLLEDFEVRISRLERRLRAVEQPVWHISGVEGGWDGCAEGPCKCRVETRSLSCWSMGLSDLPPTQLVPKNILKLQRSEQ
ncbi:hypothetical protein TSAR_006185 [Trichomalopsis sarcophagae]|uniref:Uncharacterized protein n=1 Tax=Trichomalopsis sarcophagae TaxID=543379 RepID=A0A232FDZ7_9HYME|nr:hypothetical protein TSAR_006185 [Trichomalopsis sarcophagae]